MNRHGRIVTLKTDILDLLTPSNVSYENDFEKGKATVSAYCGLHPMFNKDGLIFDREINDVTYYGFFRIYKGLKAIQKFFGVSHRTAFYLMLKAGELDHEKDKGYLIQVAMASAENYIRENKK